MSFIHLLNGGKEPYYMQTFSFRFNNNLIYGFHFSEMGKRSDLSPRKRGQIKVLLENTELSQSDIARKLGVSQQVVSNVKKVLAHGSSGTPKRKGRCGRKRLTSSTDDRALVRLSRNNRKFTSRRLWTEMCLAGVELSARTVRRRLLDAGLRAYRPRKKPKLTAVMMKKRLDWAKQFKDWTTEDWERVCFSQYIHLYCTLLTTCSLYIINTVL